MEPWVRHHVGYDGSAPDADLLAANDRSRSYWSTLRCWDNWGHPAKGPSARYTHDAAEQGAEMAEIRIDAAKAERMIAQILRDEKRFFPADANALAANICRRLTTAMPTPTNPPLQGYRIIPWHPPDGGSEFIAALKKDC